MEGWEREVLAGLDLRRYRPTVIVVEATLPTTRIESHSKWEDLLARSDYAAVYFDGVSRFYLPSEHIDLKVHFQLPPNIFDEFKTWGQAASEIEIGRLRGDLERTDDVLAVFRAEAGRLNEVLTDGRPAVADADDPNNSSTGAGSMTDQAGIDAIRSANWTLSSPKRLLVYAWKACVRSIRCRLFRGIR